MLPYDIVPGRDVQNRPDDPKFSYIVVTELGLTRLQNYSQLCKKQYEHKIQFQTDPKHLTR